MSKSKVKDMTIGSPMKLITGFAVPLLLGLLFQQVYSLMDTVIVGKCLGVEALAAVGSTGSINFLVLGFCSGMCAGFALPVAQRFGAGDYKSLRKYVGNASIISTIVAVGLTLITVVLARWILTIMKTPEDIFEGAYIYIVVIFAGIPAMILYNLLSGFLRSLGDSVTPLIFLVVSSFLNIGLDLLFIRTFGMGIFGASFATVLSQAISGLLCLVVIIKKFDILRLTKDDWKLESGHVHNLCMMGFPMGFQYSITAIGGIVLQTAVNGLGSTAVAAMTAAGKISNFLGTPFDALGSTMATFGGQNVGAGKLERLTKGLKSASVLGTVYSLGILVVLFFFGKNMVGIFVDASEVEVISEAAKFLIINAAFYVPLAFVNIVRFLIQGMGFSVFAVLAGALEMVGRAIVGIFFVPKFGFTASAFASPLAWIFADAFLIPAYFYVLKKLYCFRDKGRENK